MDVHDEYIPEEVFGACLDRLPQVCVELVVTHEDGVLLARRVNEPAAGEWFWPGSRLYKGERLTDAVDRVARDELGLRVQTEQRLGVHEHFWDTTSVEGADSRHTVNVVYRVHPEDEFAVTLDDQHDDWRLLADPDPGLHEYVQEYLAAHDLLSHD